MPYQQRANQEAKSKLLEAHLLGIKERGRLKKRLDRGTHVDAWRAGFKIFSHDPSNTSRPGPKEPSRFFPLRLLIPYEGNPLAW